MKLRLVSEGEWEENWWQEETETCWLGWKNVCTLIEGIISKTSRFKPEDAGVTFADFQPQPNHKPNDPLIPFFHSSNLLTINFWWPQRLRYR